MVDLLKIHRHSVQKNLKDHLIPQIKNIIAVGSGKGGVGKSTTAVNLALALLEEGARVGILDADIYGPSLPLLLGESSEKPVVIDQKKMLPLIKYGLQCMSIGYLIDVDSPMIWRGPMVSQALQQLLNETAWTDLDILIVDLPPGTGDIQLTLAQKIPVVGAIIVTTPQDLALRDALKAIKMFEKVDIAVLGIIENMSMHQCSNCGHREAIFGEGGAKFLLETTATTTGSNSSDNSTLRNTTNNEDKNDDNFLYKPILLGQLPLQANLRAYGDRGTPPSIVDPNSEIVRIYREIAKRTIQQLSLRPRQTQIQVKMVVE